VSDIIRDADRGIYPEAEPNAPRPIGTCVQQPKILQQRVNKIVYRRTMLRDLRDEYSENQIDKLKERVMALYLEAVEDAVQRINDVSKQYKKAIDDGNLYKTERLQKIYYKEMNKFLECFVGIESESEMRDKAVQLFMKEFKESIKNIVGDKK